MHKGPRRFFFDSLLIFLRTTRACGCGCQRPRDSQPIAKRIAPTERKQPGSTRTSRPNSWCAASCFLGGKWSWPWMLQPATGGSQDNNRSLCFAGFPSYPAILMGGRTFFFVVIPNGKVVDDMIGLDFLEQGIQNIVTWK
ncbi:hypothetical protein PVAP13_2KG577959 [Panicum virgatum]|uniref:Uncharacterized protein n=1 Tax=Panicum virgatum TaxID=38727 RepID=A0A8T0WJJ0_PANVG|nr:hypothetical protein PVAP13_2KG577959 [Panicum virgatum]